MRISTKGRYGLRVATELAAHYGEGPILVDTIARSQGISAKYIHNILSVAKSAGLVRAVRGPHGGYQLARDPVTISAREVIEALEGSMVPVECVTTSKCCPRSEFCAARGLWSELARETARVLSGTTLAQLALKQLELAEPIDGFSI